MENLNFDTIKKYGIYAIVALIVCTVVFLVYKGIKKYASNELTKAQQEHINALEINTSNVTLPQTELYNLVAKLKTAFGRYGLATDEDAVYDVFEALSTRDDILALANAFAVYKDHTLNEWLNEEMTSEEMEHIQEILASKGITYIL